MRDVTILFGNDVRVHRNWVLQDLSSQRLSRKLWVRLGAMGEDGGEIPAGGWTTDEETLGEVRVEATGILLGL